MSPSKCPLCGELAIVEDTHGLEACRVCAECGYVLSEVTLMSEIQSTVSEPIRGASVALTMALKRKASDPIGLTECLRQIKGLGKSMTFCDAMIEQASNMFMEIYKNDKFRFRHSELKRAMSVCCVYIVARTGSYPVTIREIVCISSISLVQFAKAYKLAKLCLHMTPVLTPSIGQVCGHVFASHKLPKSLLDQTQRLLLLCDETWTTFSSSNKENVVAMCSFIVWQAHNRETQIKTDCKTFCETFGFLKQKIFQQRLFHHIRHLILSMGKKLPWLETELTLKTLPWYLQDILEYKHSLIRKIFGQYSSEEDGNEKNNEELSLLRPSKKPRTDGLEETLKAEKQVEHFIKQHGSLDNPEITEAEFADEINNLIK
ncbi:transcription factor IIIB 50 kDa subunit-like isoform X2 [Gigantopelta aegis]|nr:transcription factor IIIB 50 kDa subunit-like isoform X2 [Gigantopelta aegis]XP_041369215.1 transcription factor IIIB 50 kDa subunit-like isoform X2 [Gigantopelta aegis]